MTVYYTSTGYFYHNGTTTTTGYYPPKMDRLVESQDELIKVLMSELQGDYKDGISPERLQAITSLLIKIDILREARGYERIHTGTAV